MKNCFFGFLFLLLAFTCKAQSTPKDINSLDQQIDNWHVAAAQANFETYFALTSSNFVFLGTAPGERWSKAEFMAFSKPYFDKGKAWDFETLERNIYVNSSGEFVWFDELWQRQKPSLSFDVSQVLLIMMERSFFDQSLHLLKN